MFVYKAEVLDALSRHGLAPAPHTHPQFLRDAVRDLYKFEIRRLKAQLLAKQFPKSEYADRVVQLRRGYALLSLPLDLWIKP